MGTFAAASPPRRLRIIRISVISKLRAILLGSKGNRPSGSTSVTLARKTGETNCGDRAPVAKSATTAAAEKNVGNCGTRQKELSQQHDANHDELAAGGAAVESQQGAGARNGAERGRNTAKTAAENAIRAGGKRKTALMTPASTEKSLIAEARHTMSETPKKRRASAAEDEPTMERMMSAMPRTRSVSFNNVVKAMRIETRQQRYGDLETKRAAFYTHAEVAEFKKTLFQAMALDPAPTTSCSKRDWVWKAQPSSFDSARRRHTSYLREPSRSFGGLTVHMEVAQDYSAPSENSTWIWNACASE